MDKFLFNIGWLAGYYLKKFTMKYGGLAVLLMLVALFMFYIIPVSIDKELKRMEIVQAHHAELYK